MMAAEKKKGHPLRGPPAGRAWGAGSMGKDPADARADVDADVRGVDIGNLEAAVVDRDLRRRNRELDEEVHLLDVLLLDEGERIEALHLRRDLGRVAGDVEPRDPRDAALAGQHPCPRLVGPDAERRHQSDPGYDHTPVHRSLRALSRSLLRAYFLVLACDSM